MSFSDPNKPSNVYDVIRTDQPVDPSELQGLLDTISESRFQRNGKFLGIVDFMKNLGVSIEEQWVNITKVFYLSNMTATQFFYGFMRKEENGEFVVLCPQILPFHADINHVYESKNVTTDSPANEIEAFIAFDVVRSNPASLSRRPFGPKKELAPRFRFWLQNKDIQYPVMAKRREFVIRFRCYAHSSEEAHLLVEGLEYYLDIKKEVMFGLGAQKFYVIGSEGGSKSDSGTKMAVRSLDFYLRAEQWYIGSGVGLIEKITMDWAVKGSGVSGEIDIQRPS